MLRLAHNLWTSLFPTDLVYPVQIVGDSHGQIEDDAQLVDTMKSMFRLFTYRDHFEGIPSEYCTLHSDQGWGCLLRTTQMLLAHFLLRCARADDHQLSFFFDKSGDDAPFSVHNLVQSVWSGRSFRPEYWSPSQGCRAICNTVEQAVQSGVLRTRAAVVCASNGCVYDEDVTRALAAGAESVLLLTPMRVSASAQLTQETYLQLVRLLEQPQCIGMVGGVPGRSYYFFGFSQTQLVYLDPHLCIQPAFTSDSPAARGVCVPTREQVRCVHWSRVETSCFLAFAVSSLAEWGALRTRLQTRFLHVEEQKEKCLSLSCSLHSLPDEQSSSLAHASKTSSFSSSSYPSSSLSASLSRLSEDCARRSIGISRSGTMKRTKAYENRRNRSCSCMKCSEGDDIVNDETTRKCGVAAANVTPSHTAASDACAEVVDTADMTAETALPRSSRSRSSSSSRVAAAEFTTAWSSAYLSTTPTDHAANTEVVSSMSFSPARARPVSQSIPIVVPRCGGAASRRVCPRDCSRDKGRGTRRRHRSRTTTLPEEADVEEELEADGVGTDAHALCVVNASTVSQPYSPRAKTQAAMRNGTMHEDSSGTWLDSSTSSSVCRSDEGCDVRLGDALVNESWDKMSDMDMLRSLSSTRRSPRSHARREVVYAKHSYL